MLHFCTVLHGLITQCVCWREPLNPQTLSILTSPFLPQAKSKKKNNGLLVLASARGYLADVSNASCSMHISHQFFPKSCIGQCLLSPQKLACHAVM